MSVEQFVAVMGALTALVLALGGILQQLRAARIQLDGRLTELLQAREQAALKQGELAGRDHARAELAQAAPELRVDDKA